jgi:hypothetical protein
MVVDGMMGIDPFDPLSGPYTLRSLRMETKRCALLKDTPTGPHECPPIHGYVPMCDSQSRSPTPPPCAILSCCYPAAILLLSCCAILMQEWTATRGPRMSSSRPRRISKATAARLERGNGASPPKGVPGPAGAGGLDPAEARARYGRSPIVVPATISETPGQAAGRRGAPLVNQALCPVCFSPFPHPL